LDIYVIDKDFGVIAAKHVISELKGIRIKIAEMNKLFGVIAANSSVLNVKTHLINVFFGLVIKAVATGIVGPCFPVPFIIHANEKSPK